jgi:putative glycosyltransferase (TIGR04372 family)
MSGPDIDTWLDAGRRALTEGRFAQATELFDRVLEHDQHPDALHLKGAALLQQGMTAEAVMLIQQAARSSARADYYCDLGTACYIMRDRARAEAAYRQALEIDPRHDDAAYNLANLLRERHEIPAALALYGQVLERKPQHDLAWNNCGLALLGIDQTAEAQRCFAQALQINPQNAQALLNLANLERDGGDIAQAIELYRLGLALEPRNADLYLNLGNALLGAGEAIAAVDCLRVAVECDPRNSTAHSALIFALDFDPRAGTAEHQQARRAWYASCIAPRNIAPLPLWRNPDPARRLRIGYVSADLRSSSAALCFGAVLLNHDRSRFEVFCYTNSREQDGFTQQFQGRADGWRSIHGMPDAEAAALIGGDAIDILVDLSGHMQGQRLGVFAYRPAPIQISAWGYAHGTGMPQIDCMFSDPIFIPAFERPLFAERIVDLPSVISYRPLDALPPVAPAPCVERGHLTFGCFNRVSKISAQSIALWVRLLQRLPDAKLLLKSARRSEQSALQRILHAFTDAGIAAERVGVLPHANWCAHMESYAQVDIALDPWPHSGGVSLIEALLMGVPTLAIHGRTMSSRLAHSLLHAAGLDDWVASDPDGLIELAVAKSADLRALASLRGGLRARAQGSSLGDNVSYTGVVEGRYRELWAEWSARLRVERGERLARTRDALNRLDASAALGELAPLLGHPDSEVLHLTAIARLQMHQASAARDLLQQAIAMAPQNPNLHVDLSTVLLEVGARAEAVQALQRALELAPDHGIAHYNLGNLYLQQDLLDQADEHYVQAERLLPEDAKLVNNRGVVCERRGQVDAARERYLRALALNPDYAQARMNLGRVLVEHDQVTEGVACYERALALEPQLHNLRFELVVWYERLGRWDAIAGLAASSDLERVDAAGLRRVFERIAVQVKTELAQHGRRPGQIEEQFLHYAARMMELGHPGRVWLLESILADNPDSIIAYQQLGICSYHECRYADARAIWHKGLATRDRLAARSGLTHHPVRVLDQSWTQAIGHVALLDGLIKATELGWLEKRQLYLMQTPGQRIPNLPYLEYWKGHLRVPPIDASGSNVAAIASETGIARGRLIEVTEPLWATRLASGDTLWHMEFAAAVQREWDAQGRAPLLALTPEDIAFGRERLAQLGVPDNAWFACFHVREPGFWWKWNRFHASTRDADVTSYTAAMEAVVARGGWVVRVGDTTMKKLPPMPGVVDYAHSAHKSARMDVFLTGACRFFVGVNSGLSFLPPTFGRPCVLTNFTPISVPFPYAADIAVPKLMRRRSDGRLLGIEEWFAAALADVQFQSKVPQDIEILDNDADMIRDAVVEMLDELDGRLDNAQIAQATGLRQRFDQIALGHGSFLGSRLAGSFLERFRDLL